MVNGCTTRMSELQDRVEWIGRAVWQHCRCEVDWSLKWHQRVGHAAKVVVALVLGREDRNVRWGDDLIEVAAANFHHTFNGEWSGKDWDELVVPKKLAGLAVRHPHERLPVRWEPDKRRQ